MQTQHDFFSSVLSEQGLPCLAWLVPASPKAYFKHEVFDGIDQFCDALSELDYTKYDYYFCISTLKEKTCTVNGRQRVRVKPNTLLTKSFVLDVDIRADKEDHYKTVEEGLAGVQSIVDALAMPVPTIIHSGYGLHVYWPMAEGVPSVEWADTARRFKRAVEMIAPKVVADGSRVADSAGVLRVPNSFNHKFGKQVTVEEIQTFDGFLDYGKFNAILLRITGGVKGTAKVVDIGTTFAERPPVELTDVARNCNWTREYIRTRATASEPEWYAMLGLVPYMKYTKEYSVPIEGAELAHMLSKGHKDYDPERTYLKYEQAKAGQSGPTTCEKLRSIDPSRCVGCPFAATVKSPIQTAYLDKPAEKPKVVEATVHDDQGNTKQEIVTIPVPPAPYFRGENGGVYIRTKVKLENGEWASEIQRVYDYDIYPTKRLRTESTESEAMEIHLWLPKDGLRKFRLPSGLLAEAKKLNQFLSDKGVITEFNKATRVCKYLVDYIRYLQTMHSAEVEFSRFGWRDTFSGDPKFILGDGYINKDGVLIESGIAPFLKDASKATKVQGNLLDWKMGFNVYNSIPDSDAYILAILLGFAAPLMALTEYSGVLYNIVGHSAAGKSTALKLMTSVWGEPNPEHILIGDTENSIFNFIGYLGSVPVAFDEATKMDGDKLSNFILAFTGGRGKMRATRDGHNRTNEVFWDTIVCSTSNTSLYDKLAASRRGYSAEAMRIFELNVQPSKEKYKTQVDTAIARVKNNHGIAGREYIKFVIPRVAGIKAILDTAIANVVRRGKLRNEERFWGALLACTLIGGKISRDKLHLHDYNVEGVVDRILGLTDEVRNVVVTTISDPISTLAEFFNSNLDAILRINNSVVDLNAMSGNMRSIKARVEYKDGKPGIAYISIQAVREYCALRRIDPSWLRKELLVRGVINQSSAQKRLTSGTNLPQVNVKVWEVDMANPILTQNLEETLVNTILPPAPKELLI